MTVSVDIFCEDGVVAPLAQDEIENLALTVLQDRQVTRDCCISLSFVSDKSIAELNERWRMISAPTDVLSFEMEHPDDPNLLDNEHCELGDIVIAPAYVQAQAQTFGTSFNDEVRLMLVHGVLHLMGYDHMEEDEAHVMQGIEDRLLQQIPTDKTLTTVVLTRHREEGMEGSTHA